MKSPVRQLILFGVIQEGFLVALLMLGSLRASLPLFLLFYFCAFLVYLGAVRRGYQAPAHPEIEPVEDQPGLIPIIIIFAVLFRATLFFSEPVLSEDIYRYLWDGMLLNEGINPYRYVPGSSELIDLRGPQYEMINHKDIGTPYGPLALLIFSLSQRIMDSVYFMKIPFIMFDCLSILLITRMLAFSGVSKNNVIVYAWNPLVLVEVAGSGHSDSLGVLILLAALYCILRGRYWGASIGVALSLMAKYFSLLFLPVFLKHLRKTEWILIPVLLAAGFLPFAEYLEPHILNMAAVGSSWRFNDSLFSLLVFVTGSLFISKALVVIAMVLLAVAVWVSRWSPVKSATIMIGAALLLTTTVQPWYLLWIVPFLCFSLNRAWLLLTGLVMLSYHILILYDAQGVWVESLWIKLVIYIPFYLLLISDGLKNTFRNLRSRSAA